MGLFRLDISDMAPVKKSFKVPAGQKGKKKKVVLKYTIDCTHPVEDGIMDVASFEKFLHERIKINGRTGNLNSSGVTIEKQKSKLLVTAEIQFSKRQVPEILDQKVP